MAETSEPLTFTQAAREEIARRHGEDQRNIRLGLRGGGCNGLSYVFEWAGDPEKGDHVFTVGPKHVLVDPKSMVYLRGCTVDFQRGTMWSGFRFLNPNAKSECGCGKSIQF